MTGRLIVAQLSADSPPGLLLPWARSRGLAVDVVRVDRCEPLPPVAEAAGIVVLGTGASVRDTGLSWLAPARHWVAEALATDVPVLGIALGAQLLASILGAEVAPAPAPEVGWVRLESDDATIASGPWIAYNQDTVVVPSPAWTTVHNGNGTQAFRTGPHLGIQFHAHATPDIVRAWAEQGRFDVPPRLPDEVRDHIVVMARHARALFSGWAADAGIARSLTPAAVRVAS